MSFDNRIDLRPLTADSYNRQMTGLCMGGTVLFTGVSLLATGALLGNADLKTTGLVYLQS